VKAAVEPADVAFVTSIRQTGVTSCDGRVRDTREPTGVDADLAVITTHETQADLAPEGPSDADLLLRVRNGDQNAYGELYVRHEPAATSLARYLTRSNHEADDVVADAFARVLRAIKGGAGPTEAFRPYLLTAVRRTVWRHSEEANHHRLAASDDEAEMIDLRLAVEPEDRTDEGIILQAFQGLPERWQLVLWHTEIEGQPPAQVAPLLGLSPNATAALAVRAREGLRQAFLQAHLQAQPPESCRFSVEHLGSFVRDGLGKRDNAKVEAHLADCEECQALQSELGSLNKALRSVVGPAVLGAGAARWLQTRAAETAPQVSGLEQARQVAHRIRFPQALGAAGAAAFLFATLGLNSNLGRSPVPQLDAAAATPIAETVVPERVVDVALIGTTEPDRASGVQATACEGAVLPLSLPAGATPTSASLVQTDRAVTVPTILDPDAANDFTPVDTGGATTLVGDGSLCVTDLIQPLDGAPANTGLVVGFLDDLGNLQLLLVPQIVDQVRDAVTQISELATTINAQLADYLRDVTAALEQTAGADGVSGTLDDVVGGTGVEVPELPTGGGSIDLPAVETPDVGTVVDDTVSGVEDVVGGVGDTVDGVVCGLLGC
jgi:RNA polymerase sigma factor (sigma-70 family)